MTDAPAVPVRFDVVALDTPDPPRLSAFYCALLGWTVERADEDWITISGGSGARLAFQLAPDHVAPTWPDPAVPQQMHLDVMVEDPAAAAPRVLALGARRLAGGDVFADPAGHPFCLVRRPGWAPPLPPG
jgi:catechol 2,3-dioxygenase-like lactoylglutathione lyase family enzyme